MADQDKKITDLQLISSVIDSLLIPVDNSTQTYRATALQFMTYMGKALKWPVTSKTTTYTASVDDTFISCSTGSAWTLTLFAASGNAGKILIVKKTSNDTNALTIDGNASETIDGSTTIKLYNRYEAVVLICDGSNWHIVERVNAGVIFVGYVASNQALTADVTNLPLTSQKDSHGAFASGEFTVPSGKDGDYEISATLINNSGTGTYYSWLNGTGSRAMMPGVTTAWNTGMTVWPGLVAGDKISIRSNAGVTTLGNAGSNVCIKKVG